MSRLGLTKGKPHESLPRSRRSEPPSGQPPNHRGTSRQASPPHQPLRPTGRILRRQIREVKGDPRGFLGEAQKVGRTPRKSGAHRESRQETLKVWSSARRTKVRTYPTGHWRTGTAESLELGKAHESPNLPRRADGSDVPQMSTSVARLSQTDTLDEPEPTTRHTRAEAPTHAWDASTTPDRR